MRTKNSIKIAKHNLISFIITLIVGFVTRRLFLQILGDTIGGLNTMLQSLVGLLSITELGLSSVIGFSLYKPLKDNDYERINEVVTLYKYFYIIISMVMLLFGIVLSFFMNYFIKSENLSGIVTASEAQLYLLLFIVNTIFSYILGYKQIILDSDQKGYIAIRINYIIKLIKGTLQVIVLIVFRSYLSFILIDISTNLIAFLIINRRAHSEYPWFSVNKNLNKSELFRRNKDVLISTGNVFFHKIGTFVVFQTDSLLLGIFSGLTIANAYANYMTFIITPIAALATMVLSSIAASVGNLVAENNSKKSFEVFYNLFLIEFTVATILTICTYNLINPFVSLWLGSKYILSNGIVFALMVNLFLNINRQVVGIFRNGYGIFFDKWAPLIEAVINLVFSLIFLKFFGMVGVVLGTIISNVSIIMFWRPFTVYNYGFKKKFTGFLKLYSILIGILIIVFVISNFFVKYLEMIIYPNTIINWVLCGIIEFIFVSVLTLSLLFINKSFRKSLTYSFKSVISNIKK